jgi:hypothetical protein
MMRGLIRRHTSILPGKRYHTADQNIESLTRLIDYIYTMEVVTQKLSVLRTKLDKYPILQDAEVSLSV